MRRFLGAKGDPYALIGLDRDGRAGIDWGVYGVPETFVVKGDGTHRLQTGRADDRRRCWRAR